MDKQSFPTLEIQQTEFAGSSGDAFDSIVPTEWPTTDAVSVVIPKTSQPISSVMEKTLWIIEAEDTIEKVEEMLVAQSLTSIPVRGSNGAIVGIIGPQELMLFHADKKNAKAIRAWEISRCTIFEVGPDDCVEYVAKLMAENKIEYIAVTHLGGLQGVVSSFNLMQAMLQEKTDEATALDPFRAD